VTAPRRILVTGASRGLGLALVEHFVARGDRVVGCSSQPAPAEFEGYHHVRTDVTSEPDVTKLFADVRAELGGLDVLINNAGIASMNPVALMPAATARQVVDVSVMGTFLCSRAALRLLRSSVAPRIVNVSSVAVPLRLDGEAMYAAAKSAVESFTRIMAKEVGPLGITCNAVGPCPVPTRLTEAVPKEKMAALIARQAIPKWGSSADVVNVVEFFLSPASEMVTGQVVYLGGIS
jgi:3-oxoacyl-[acyl-carrier protein] reductase